MVFKLRSWDLTDPERIVLREPVICRGNLSGFLLMRIIIQTLLFSIVFISFQSIRYAHTQYLNSNNVYKHLIMIRVRIFYQIIALVCTFNQSLRNE